MSSLALSQIRTGAAASIAYDRDNAYTRKAELLLGATPTDAALVSEAERAAGNAAAAAAAAEEARLAASLTTSSGRRVKVCVCLGGGVLGAGPLVGMPPTNP
jgi:hypothetical protein